MSPIIAQNNKGVSTFIVFFKPLDKKMVVPIENRFILFLKMDYDL